MYCTNCGNKILNRAKFCSQCGAAHDSSLPQQVQSAQPLQPIQTAPQPVRKKTPMIQRIIGLFIGISLLTILVGYFSASTPGSEQKNVVYVIFGIGIAILGFFLFIEFFRLLIKSIPKLLYYLFKHPKLIPVVILMTAIIIFIGQQAFQRYEYKRSKTQLISIQDNLAEVMVAKSIGNSIMEGKFVPSGWWWSIVNDRGKEVSLQLKRLTVSTTLKDYVSSINQWSNQISVSSQNTWDILPSQPDQYKIILTTDQVIDAMKTSLDKITTLKELGDTAISKYDRQTMYYIAAKLQVQQQWLEGLSTSTKPYLFALDVKDTYAAERPIVKSSASIKRRNPCIKRAKKVCLDDVRKIIPRVYRSALGYAVGEPDSPQQWNDNWTQAEPTFSSAGYPIGGIGITQGTNDKPTYSPRVQRFFNNCSARGGIVGGTGGVKERLPTTEDGRTCWYKNGDNQCWDFLTYSGGNYMGGNPGCQEQGLVPKIPTPRPTRTIIPTTQVITKTSWDGNYSINSNMSCNVPGLYSSGMLPFSDNLTVRGNRIINPQGGSAAIDSSGYARISTNINSGGASIGFVQSFNFYKDSGDRSYVKGSLSLNGGSSYGGASVSINCSGSFSGSRN